MRLKHLFVVFLLVFVKQGFGQTFESKYLKGRVIADGKDVAGVTIQNISTRRATITDSNGNFSIQVKLNDTLVFSAVQFKRKLLPITKDLMDSPFVTVPLEEFVNELREVVVNPYNLSGNLGADLDGLQLEKDVSAEALDLPNAEVRIISQSENKLNDADHGKFLYFYGLGFAINVNKILNRLSGRTKMLKERVALDKAYADVKLIEDSYQDSILMSHLKIPKTNFYDFIHFCEMDESFKELTNQNDELKLWQFLFDKSKVYRRENSLD